VFLVVVLFLGFHGVMKEDPFMSVLVTKLRLIHLAEEGKTLEDVLPEQYFAIDSDSGKENSSSLQGEARTSL